MTFEVIDTVKVDSEVWHEIMCTNTQAEYIRTFTKEWWCEMSDHTFVNYFDVHDKLLTLLLLNESYKK